MGVTTPKEYTPAMKLYKEKNELLSERFEEVSAYEFYRDIFPEGSFEVKGKLDEGKPNGIAVDLSKGRGEVERWIINDDLEKIKELSSARFAIMSPISYYGRSRHGRNASFLYAFTFDIDGVGNEQLRDLIHEMYEDILPLANYIVNSGNGVHLYYLFEEPIPMYPQNQIYLKNFKYALTERLWNYYTSTIEKPQMQGILQGFRIVGSQSKHGEGYPVRAFKVHENRWTLARLKDYIVIDRNLKALEVLEKNSKMPLEEAKKKYPEWYERRIERKERRGRWSLNRAVYDYWKYRIEREATVGHRYFTIMTLAIYAKKCSSYDAKKNPNPVTEEELRRDAYKLLRPYNNMKAAEGNPFSEDDLNHALEMFNEDYVTFPRKDIEKVTAIRIEPSVRRNGAKQKDHLEEARAIRDIRQRRKGRDWWEGNGRPQGSGTAKDKVKKWRKRHPDGTKAECNRATGLDPKTIRKWWDA